MTYLTTPSMHVVYIRCRTVIVMYNSFLMYYSKVLDVLL